MTKELQTIQPTPDHWQLFEGTLEKDALVSGIGLHTGHKTTVRLLPRSGQKNQRGILFRRPGPDGACVSVRPGKRHWGPHLLCSTLKAADGTLFRTVEHLLAALLFCEIDHAIVELDGEEIPILDGSAVEWIHAIKACGRAALPFPKSFLKITTPYEYTFGSNSSYAIEPASSYRISLSNRDRGAGLLLWEGEMTPTLFADEVAPARSYGRVFDGLAAMAAGYLTGIPLLRGARAASVAAVFNERILGGARFPDEFVRHRVLDACGDFSIAGAPVLGHFRIHQPSHRRNHKFMRHILRQRPDMWEWATFVKK